MICPPRFYRLAGCVALVVGALSVGLTACSRSDTGSGKFANDTLTMSASLTDETPESLAVAVPGIPDTVRLARVTHYCTLVQDRNSDRLTDIFGGGDTAVIFHAQSVQAAQARAGRIKGQLGGVLSSTQWRNGQTIRVAFINGDPSLQQRVMGAAREWSQYANIDFAPATSLNQADVRVKFTSDDKSWSNLGNEALANTRPDSQTVQFGWLTPASTDAEVREVVLHEFGHTLGMIHEHQQPNATVIPWNRNKVYAYYWYYYKWPPRDVDEQVLSLYSASVTQFTQFDTTSIMLYAIPGELTDNRLVVDWNTKLSATDKAFIRRMYPGR